MEKTFRKYVEVARGMRLIGSMALDIKNLNETEAYIVTALVKNDAIFNFFDEVKDIDVRKIYAVCKVCEWQEKYRALLI